MPVLKVLAWIFLVAMATGGGVGALSSNSVNVATSASLSSPSGTSVHHTLVSNGTEDENPAEMVEMVAVTKKSTITIQVSEVLSTAIIDATKDFCISFPASLNYTGCVIANDWYPGARTQDMPETSTSPSNHTQKSLAAPGLANPFKLPIDFLKRHYSVIVLRTTANTVSTAVVLNLAKRSLTFFEKVGGIFSKVSPRISKIFANIVKKCVPFSRNKDEKWLQEEFRAQQEAIWARLAALRIRHRQDLALRLDRAHAASTAVEYEKESASAIKVEGLVEAGAGAGAQLPVGHEL